MSPWRRVSHVVCSKLPYTPGRLIYLHQNIGKKFNTKTAKKRIYSWEGFPNANVGEWRVRDILNKLMSFKMKGNVTNASFIRNTLFSSFLPSYHTGQFPPKLIHSPPYSPMPWRQLIIHLIGSIQVPYSRLVWISTLMKSHTGSNQDTESLSKLFSHCATLPFYSSFHFSYLLVLSTLRICS